MTSILIAVFDLTIIVKQASFHVYELTEHGVTVLFSFFFMVKLTLNKHDYLLVKSTYGDCI